MDTNKITWKEKNKHTLYGYVNKKKLFEIYIEHDGMSDLTFLHEENPLSFGCKDVKQAKRVAERELKIQIKKLQKEIKVLIGDKKPFHVTVILGDRYCNLYNEIFDDGEEPEEKNLNELKDGVHYFSFATQEELNAFCLGINEGSGWLQGFPLSDEEAKKLEKTFEENEI